MGGEEAEPARSPHTESLRGDQGSPSPQQSPRGSAIIAAAGHNTAGGRGRGKDGSGVTGFATTSSPEQVSAAEASAASEGCSACWQLSSPHRDGHRNLRRGRGRGRGRRCKNPQGDARDRHCWLQPNSLPDPRRVLFRPQPCQGRVPRLTQALQEATGKETSSTSSPPQTPTQPCLALGPEPKTPGRTAPRGIHPSAAGNLSTDLREAHPKQHYRGCRIS